MHSVCLCVRLSYSCSNFWKLSHRNFVIGTQRRFIYSIAECVTGQSHNSKLLQSRDDNKSKSHVQFLIRCPTVRVFNAYYIFVGEYVICINTLTVECLLENVHGVCSWCGHQPGAKNESGVTWPRLVRATDALYKVSQ